MASWGNEAHTQYGQDMEPDGNYKLKVSINREAAAILAAVGLFLILGGCTEKNYYTNPPIDHTPPVVAWLAPSPDAELSGEVELSFTASDTSGIDRISVYRNGLNPQDWNLYPQSTQDTLQTLHWDTSDHPDGLYILEIRALDESGNLGVSPSLLVRLTNGNPPTEDRTPPSITWLSPEPGSEVYGTTTLKFEVTDSSVIDSVIVYLQGRELQFFLENIGTHLDGEVLWFTTDYSDGNYIVQVKAWDSFRNAGSSEVISFTVKNDRPRVIWVPDDYETIQGAINASKDGDTVRVRAGEYNEGIVITKLLWLESADGPELTTINASNSGIGIIVEGAVRDTIGSAIRGFTIKNADYYGIFLRDGGGLRIMNNIILINGRAGIWISYGTSNASIINNTIITNFTNLYLYLTFSNISNNILIIEPIGNDGIAFFNGYLYINQVKPDYNLAFGYAKLTNNPPIQFGENNIFGQDPLFIDENSLMISEFSPALNSGNPELLDPDGSRSDMGAFGGPFAYP